MMRSTELAHLLMRQTLKPGDWALDATVGNGHDTVMLAQAVGPSGRVFGFDVQETALAETAERVADYPQVTLLHAGHETLEEHLPKDGHLAGVMFNLGYLPGGSREVITRADTTIAALNQAFERLKVGGLLTLILYPGHKGGDQEAATVQEFVDSLDGAFAVAQYKRLNPNRPAPELLAIERMR